MTQCRDTVNLVLTVVGVVKVWVGSGDNADYELLFLVNSSTGVLMW